MASMDQTERASMEREAGRLARMNADWAGMALAGGRLKHLGYFGEAWELLADAASGRRPPLLPDWRGEDIKNDILLVERRIAHIGAELRMMRFVALAARRAKRVIVATEDRLLPLLQRSFPEASFVDKARPELYAHATCGASYERLGHLLAPNQLSIRASFRRFVAPAHIMADIRRRRNGAKPVVGVAWYSSNQRKSLPDLGDWASFLAGYDAHYASLQYQEDEHGLTDLCRMAGRPIDGADGIDQMNDLDAFAAQVASVDAVVTITNTTRHMAGVLDIPCILVIDDDKAGGDRLSPFYPREQAIHRQGRSWSVVFDEARLCLDQVLLE